MTEPEIMRFSACPGASGTCRVGPSSSIRLGTHVSTTSCPQPLRLPASRRVHLAQAREPGEGDGGCLSDRAPCAAELGETGLGGAPKQGRCSSGRKLPDIPVGSRCRPWQVQSRCGQVWAGVGQRASSTAWSGRPGAGWIRTAVHCTDNGLRNRPCGLRRPTTFSTKGALLLKANGEAGLFRPRRLQQRCHLLNHLIVFKALSWPRAAQRRLHGEPSFHCC